MADGVKDCRRTIWVWALACAFACAPLTPRPDEVPLEPDASRPPTSAEALALLRSPEAARIVVAQQGKNGSRLVLLREDGKRFTDLTEPDQEMTVDVMPAWSPTGLDVAFVSSRGDAQQWSLHVLYLLDGSVTRFADHPGFDANPSWSPDGTKIVFSSNPDGSHDLYLVEITRDAKNRPASTAVKRITNTSYDAIEPSWSPDGQQIAFVARDGELSRLQLYNVASGKVRDLTVGPFDRSPCWHPNAKIVVFSAPAAERDDSDLHAVDIVTGARKHLIDDALGSEVAPVFSQDGRHVFATSVFKGQGGDALLSSVVFADLANAAPQLQALYGRFLSHRHGVALAPVPLDAEALTQAPDYRSALKDMIRRHAGEDKDRE